MTTSVGREFRAPGLSPDDLGSFTTPRFVIARERVATVRRTWLDTVDGRLAKRGFTLRHIKDDRRCWLRLTGPDVAIAVLVSAELPRWPADLPPAVARHVSALLDVRALLPMGESSVRATVFGALDSEGKTVARLVAERGSTGTLVRVEELRGYAKAATTLAGLLARDPRLTAAEPDRPALPALARPPKLDRAQPAAAGVAAILIHLLDVVEENVEGTIAALDTEFLHDLRVAVRRSRSVLKLGADVLPAGVPTRFGPRLRWLGDLTTPPRDLDVLLLDLPKLRAALPQSRRDDLDVLAELVQGRLEQAYRELGRGLGSARFRAFTASWRTELDRIGGRAAGGTVGLGSAADAWASAAMRKVVRRGGRISDASPPQDLHDLRKRCKELRYCLEMFAPVWDRDALAGFIRELKSLQDNLGDFQDSEVQRDTLRAWAGELTGSSTEVTAAVLAIGELAGRFDQQQEAARAEFAERFARFSRPATLRRFAALTAGSGSIA